MATFFYVDEMTKQEKKKKWNEFIEQSKGYYKGFDTSFHEKEFGFINILLNHLDWWKKINNKTDFVNILEHNRRSNPYFMRDNEYNGMHAIKVFLNFGLQKKYIYFDEKNTLYIQKWYKDFIIKLIYQMDTYYILKELLENQGKYYIHNNDIKKIIGIQSVVDFIKLDFKEGLFESIKGNLSEKYLKKINNDLYEINLQGTVSSFFYMLDQLNKKKGA